MPPPPDGNSSGAAAAAAADADAPPAAPSSSSAADDPLDPLGPPDDLLINCWSGPRCCSTSLMYSFAQRSDAAVCDEPLYASYLEKTGAPRPYRRRVLAAQSSDANAVVRDVLRLGQARGAASGRRVMYAKHMSKHKVGAPQALWTRARHVLLVRDPAAVLVSFARVLPPTLAELGYPALLEVASELRAAGRPPPVVVLSDDLARRPEATLRALCRELGLPFERAMLSWPAGPKPYDGCWAGHWYAQTHRSTCFDVAVRDPRGEPLPDGLKPLLGECWPAFEALRRVALRPLTGAELEQEQPQHQQHEQMGGGGGGGGVPRPLSAKRAADPSKRGAAAAGTHAFRADPRNEDVLVGVRDGALPSHCWRRPPPAPGSSAALLAASAPPAFDLVWRPQARVSALDSAFMLGDGLWEGLRAQGGVVLFARQHLDRLWEGMRALDMRLGMTRAHLLAMVHATLDANCGMGAGAGATAAAGGAAAESGDADTAAAFAEGGGSPPSPSAGPAPPPGPSRQAGGGVHVRLMVSRGLKSTPYQDPACTIGLPLVVCLPEWKRPSPSPYKRGLALATVPVRRGAPDVQDPSLNSHSKINCIAACVAAKKAGGDEALMLDPHGFVATCNSTNFFAVRCGGELWAPRGGYQRRGVTRENVLSLARGLGMVVRETDFALAEVWSSEEAFVTGTFGGIVPVREVDGRRIGDWRAEDEGRADGEGELERERQREREGDGRRRQRAEEGQGQDEETEEEEEEEEGGLAALLAGDVAGPVTRRLARAYGDLCAREAVAGRAAAMAALGDVGGGSSMGGGGGGGRR